MIVSDRIYKGCKNHSLQDDMNELIREVFMHTTYNEQKEYAAISDRKNIVDIISRMNRMFEKLLKEIEQ